MAAPPPAQTAPQPPPPSTAGVSGPGSAGASVPGPPQSQGPQGQQPPSAQLVAASQIQAAQSGLLQQQQQDFDPVQRYKLLIPQLKESLQNLMKVAAQNLVQNTNIDNGQKSSEGGLQRFDKSLEEFYALCDQLELCLNTAILPDSKGLSMSTPPLLSTPHIQPVAKTCHFSLPSISPACPLVSSDTDTAVVHHGFIPGLLR
ncbi:mediator of RNA polymerase II transcription subunit 29 isoform X2 [Antechinus flavipes]|uniref:mediator of RNA polymerase II transcription subunit 29 isoform X2 n=1 Tax=Antechinus flavipes TaxID=38775 RepID=UPI002235F87E|nr:mediator of RNA polymerase II transcription subunit 29 isoform X2 [Antechinus flavipes]